MAELGDKSDKEGTSPKVSHNFVVEIDRQGATGNSPGVLGGRTGSLRFDAATRNCTNNCSNYTAACLHIGSSR